MQVMFARKSLLLLALGAVSNADWFDSKDFIFWGKISGPNVTVTKPIKGCLTTETVVKVKGLEECTFESDLAVLIGAFKESGDPEKKVWIETTCADVVAHPIYSYRAKIAQHVDVCEDEIMCAGEPSKKCYAKNVCGPKKKWKKICDEASTCEVNKCDCSPIFTNDDGEKVCTNVCPDGSNPIECSSNPCDYSTARDVLEGCPEAGSARFCEPSTCGGCKAQWFDRFGSPVCQRGTLMCETSYVNLGKAIDVLGFRPGKKGECESVEGEEASIGLFPNKEECEGTCKCQENGMVDFGPCKKILGFTVIMGKCQQVSGCPNNMLAGSFFETKKACEQTCKNLPVPVLAVQPTPAVIQPTPRSVDICPEGIEPVECYASQYALDEECAELTCGNITDFTCQANPCGDCDLQVVDADGFDITDQCERIVSDQCPLNSCSLADDEEPECGPEPSHCQGTKLQCIFDKCTCKSKWVATDIRPTGESCTLALGKCEMDCPRQFTCEPFTEKMVEDFPAHVLKQLECAQEPCTCKPRWRNPDWGLREPCKEGDPNCCPDGLVEIDCDLEGAAETCAEVTCEGAVPATCSSDGCAQCGLTIYDANDKVIPAPKCKVPFAEDLRELCSGVKCPESALEQSCPPRPGCYPDDWQLTCVIDPCSCQVVWLDQDVRSKLECFNEIKPQCVMPNDCPRDFTCKDMDLDTLAQLPLAMREELMCIQEPCTCRPIMTTPDMLPPSYRARCDGDDCCADGLGPEFCDVAAVQEACPDVKCYGEQKKAACMANGCDLCSMKVVDKLGKEIPINECRLELPVECPGIKCPAKEKKPDCGPRPKSCPRDWNLRCVWDPCVCDRAIWLDEDLREASLSCIEEVDPPCVPASDCPANFNCDGLVPGLPPGILPCKQQECTCRPIPDMEKLQALIGPSLGGGMPGAMGGLGGGMMGGGMMGGGMMGGGMMGFGGGGGFGMLG